jgi:hypothetical protein
MSDENEGKSVIDEILERNRRLMAEQLAKAKADAQANGKEPFDLEALERLCDTSGDGVVAPIDERRARFEYKYYVENPSIRTIADFAALLRRAYSFSS